MRCCTSNETIGSSTVICRVVVTEVFVNLRLTLMYNSSFTSTCGVGGNKRSILLESQLNTVIVVSHATDGLKQPSRERPVAIHQLPSHSTSSSSKSCTDNNNQNQFNCVDLGMKLHQTTSISSVCSPVNRPNTGQDGGGSHHDGGSQPRCRRTTGTLFLELCESASLGEFRHLLGGTFSNTRQLGFPFRETDGIVLGDFLLKVHQS
mmetsp:Transcript_34952/g.84567  ORF Transcript_34952/g.84567 Transcript_34952/m.84567 type:complete len:206 (-) Transcript_34952:1677-2294(-)